MPVILGGSGDFCRFEPAGADIQFLRGAIKITKYYFVDGELEKIIIKKS